MDLADYFFYRNCHPVVLSICTYEYYREHYGVGSKYVFYCTVEERDRDIYFYEMTPGLVAAHKYDMEEIIDDLSKNPEYLTKVSGAFRWEIVAKCVCVDKNLTFKQKVRLLKELFYK